MQCFTARFIYRQRHLSVDETCCKTLHEDGQTHSDRLEVCSSEEQEAQLSQRDRATLRVIEYSAKSLKITQDHEMTLFVCN